MHPVQEVSIPHCLCNVDVVAAAIGRLLLQFHLQSSTSLTVLMQTSAEVSSYYLISCASHVSGHLLHVRVQSEATLAIHVAESWQCGVLGPMKLRAQLSKNRHGYSPLGRLSP